ncbi:kinesin-like protein KIN-10B isoform X1 [Chenopodium quinoa]|uniref:kinesin-like protein KIN-10B isoform X1 n=1 Tax=Chenopodium quinoa TaxID=63459 RepID=UPI000B7977E1|nr:kinesin-like protein KIN-10B isoform X1 [Chenopodium quinoa]
MASNLKPFTPAKSAKSSTKVSKVRVIVRVRPFLSHEIASISKDSVPCVSTLTDNGGLDFDHEVSIHLKDQETSRQEWYKLDGFFGEEHDNVVRIFEKEVKPLIPGIFHGCNATVFAYGATGSGKTYTMQGTDVKPGLMLLAMSTVLSMCQATGNFVEISYYEVYLDKCYDLLELKENEISVLDDKEGQTHLRGLSRVFVTSMSEFHDVFARGIQRRKVAHTGLNDVSSRSHGVLVITVSKPSDQGLETSITGKLNLIDLAGNEDNRRSGNEGTRLQESAKINQSLFALSNVIYALNNNKPRVPYRETKLTRILQDSLGGTSRALMVACLNPGAYQEAAHTVSLAARSRDVSNVISKAQKQETPKVKIDMEKKLQSWLESKGKVKSSQRKIAFGSPIFHKSPGSISSIKKQAVPHSSSKAKVANQGVTVKDSFLSVPQWKLFSPEASSESCKVDLLQSVCVQELEGLKDLSLNETEVLTVLEDRQFNNKSTPQKFEDSHCVFYKLKDPVAEDSLHQSMMNSTSFESTTCLPDELLEDDEWENIRAGNLTQSPLNRPKIMACQSPLRKALSLVDSNITRLPVEEVSSRDNVLSLLFESSAPKTPFVVTRDKFQDFGTPLDKFNARSSNMKSYLAQEYIDFLNTATREELVELKGIGVKRAEYIIELRESSALKSLNDLEKIGLSSKQVQQMFSKAAKDIFA